MNMIKSAGLLVAAAALAGAATACAPTKTVTSSGQTAPASAQAAPTPAAVTPSPDAKGQGSCDTSLSTSLYGQDYLTAAVNVTNDGNIGEVVKVKVAFPQQGFSPLRAARSVRLHPGQTKTVNLHIPASSQQISNFQDVQLTKAGTSDPCSYKLIMDSTFGQAQG